MLVDLMNRLNVIYFGCRWQWLYHILFGMGAKNCKKKNHQRRICFTVMSTYTLTVLYSALYMGTLDLFLIDFAFSTIQQKSKKFDVFRPKFMKIIFIQFFSPYKFARWSTRHSRTVLFISFIIKFIFDGLHGIRSIFQVISQCRVRGSRPMAR